VTGTLHCLSVLLAGSVAVATLAAPSPCRAETNAVLPVEGLREAGTNIWSTANGMRTTVSTAVTEAASSLDKYLEKKLIPAEDRPSEILERFYGLRRMEDEGNDSQIAVEPVVEYDENGFGAGIRFNVRLKLPRCQNRLEIIANNLDDDSVALQDFSTLREAARETDHTDDEVAGLRIRLIDRVKSRLSLDTGLSFRPEPAPRIRLRGRLVWSVGKFQMEPTESVFWQSGDGFGERTEFEIARPLSSQTVVKATSAAVWSETSVGVELGQSVSLFHVLNHRTVVGARAGIAGHKSSPTVVDKYALKLVFRRRLAVEWLRLSVEPGIEFARDNDFDLMPLIKVGLEAVFGKITRD
jgi:hypothetical protein